ncbi:hypothetical protein PC119_g23783 [Phytophthora cactorum]|nr:hypothetical protein PC114_g24278 [Phytophthora cactorum]KAG2969913.1 hypothetical protein PC119_g23783 [Phytophthora cactorum]
MALAAEPTMVPLLASRLRGSGSWPMFVSLGLGAGSTVVPLLAWKHLLNHNAGRAASKQWSSMPCTPCLYLRVVGVGHGSSGDVDLFVAALPVKEILEHGTLSDRKATYPGKNEGV